MQFYSSFKYAFIFQGCLVIKNGICGWLFFGTKGSNITFPEILKKDYTFVPKELIETNPFKSYSFCGFFRLFVVVWDGHIAMFPSVAGNATTCCLGRMDRMMYCSLTLRESVTKLDNY